ncbi:MAG: alpha-hydroxy acid oxidase [Mesorhizobium sp.]
MSLRINEAINLHDMRECARAKLPRIAFDYIDGGVHDERGLEVNRRAFDRYSLMPRYLVDVAKPDQSVEIFGRTYSSPVGVAPMGIAGFFRPGADLMLARAAAASKVPYVMSSASCDFIEAAAEVAPGNVWFQVYGTRNPEITDDLVARAAAARAHVLVLTVDTPTVAGRERNHRNGFKRPVKMTPSIIMQGVARPRWTISYLRNGGMPVMQNWAPYAKDPTAEAVADLYGRETPAPGQTWDALARVRRLWKGPLMVKGILSPQDALLCKDHGADGIILSNHGARQLDRAPSPLEIVTRVRDAVGESMVLAMDSGIRRGSDVVIAACLGIRFALIGRPAMFAVAAGGEAGARRAFHILHAEIDTILAQIGTRRFSDLSDKLLIDRFRMVEPQACPLSE